MLAGAMTAVLYAIPASHPCAAVERALQLKRVPYRRVELIPGLHVLQQRARFGAGSVPGVTFDDGAQLVGSRAIVRALEERVAEPALLPPDGDLRKRVERAEEWGDQVLQPLARRVIWAALRRSPGSVPSYSEGAQLPVPVVLARVSAPLTAVWGQARNRAGDANVRADLRSLRFHLDRIDRWIERGVMGGEDANAADLQIGASLALLLTIADLGPLLEPRPAAGLARRWFSDYPGSVAAGTLPWLQTAH
jgi:glutathione S-transferase